MYNKRGRGGGRRGNGPRNGGNRTREVVTRIPRPVGFPDRMQCTLKYEDIIEKNPGTSFWIHAFRGNSCYDPDLTGTGHQPVYFDQYMSVYNRYKVQASRIVVECLALGSVATVVVLFPQNITTSPGSYAQAAEQPRAKLSKILGVSGVYPSCKVSASATTKEIAGLGGDLVDQDFSGTSSTNPNDIWYWYLFASAHDQSSNIATSIRVSIFYNVLFYERILASAS